MDIYAYGTACEAEPIFVEFGDTPYATEEIVTCLACVAA